MFEDDFSNCIPNEKETFADSHLCSHILLYVLKISILWAVKVWLYSFGNREGHSHIVKIPFRAWDSERIFQFSNWRVLHIITILQKVSP